MSDSLSHQAERLASALGRIELPSISALARDLRELGTRAFFCALLLVVTVKGLDLVRDLGLVLARPVFFFAAAWAALSWLDLQPVLHDLIVTLLSHPATFAG